MLIKLTEEKGEIWSINSDYIIDLLLKKHETKFLVVARMIDGTLLPLTEHLAQTEANIEYTRIMREANTK